MSSRQWWLHDVSLSRPPAFSLPSLVSVQHQAGGRDSLFSVVARMTARRSGYRTGSGYRLQCPRHGTRHLVAEGCPYCRADRLLHEAEDLRSCTDQGTRAEEPRDDEPPQKR